MQSVYLLLLLSKQIWSVINSYNKILFCNLSCIIGNRAKAMPGMNIPFQESKIDETGKVENSHKNITSSKRLRSFDIIIIYLYLTC